MNIELTGKVVVITGAESGIGRAIARACAEAGAAVCVSGLLRAGLAETAALIEGDRSKIPALAVVADIRDPEAIENLFRTSRNHFGRLDGVVANAGLLPTVVPAHEVTLAEWSRTIGVNLTGTFLTVSVAARHLIEQGQGGSIIATGSSTAIRPIAGTLAYVASKGGVHAMMQVLALELGPYNIRVNTIVPGQTETPPLQAIPGYIEQAARALPLRSITQPEEIVRYVAFALSDAVPHLTGSQLKVDSGRTIG